MDALTKALSKAMDDKSPTAIAVSVAAVGVSAFLLKKLIFSPGYKKEKQVVLITGASSGIGKKAALDFIQKGHIVYGAARRVDKMQDLVAAGGHALAVDVGNDEQVDAAVKKVIAEQKRIDVLINNAGYAVYGSVEDITMEEARRQFDVNIFGLARLTKEVLPYMRAANSGTIINTSSMGGKIYTPYGSWYHATKHALEGFSDCLRLELKQFGINVVIVEPGAIRTEFGAVMMPPLIERSKGGPYEASVNKYAENAGPMESSGSDPKVISDVMLEAATSKKPKRRYLVGKYANEFCFIRNWFGDAALDAILLNMM
uniref:Uncharacterized protein n=1 Tax=Grammatophora oceanica TaxID=210454 RepID=A0A7S1URD9_9STRA